MKDNIILRDFTGITRACPRKNFSFVLMGLTTTYTNMLVIKESIVKANKSLTLDNSPKVSLVQMPIEYL